MEAAVGIFPPKPKHKDVPALSRRHPSSSSCPFGHTDSIVPPELFKGLTVFVQSDNPTEQSSVRQALQLAGAVIRESSEAVDVVVSPSRLVKPPAVPAPPRSRGARLVLAAGPPPPAKNVLFAQIPWVPAVLRLHEQSQKAVAEPERRLMVVADVAGRYQPIFHQFKALPTLHFGAIPRGYSDTPFDPIPDDETIRDRVRARATRVWGGVAEMPRKGFCECCQVDYADGDLHRSSAMHRAQTSNEKWSEFDRISAGLRGLG